jgi:hypothetical protein
MAANRRDRTEGLVIHSDRGVQFTSWAISHKVRDAGIARRWEPSAAPMTMRWSSHSHNTRRRHSALGMLSPIDEVQLRTELQDVWANAVETDARRIAPGLKFGAGPAELRDFYVALGDFLANADQGRAIDDALLQRVLGLQERVVTLRRAHDEP